MSKRIAQGLALVGIGIGIAEVVAPKALARCAGIGRHSNLVQAAGVREILTGLLVLAAGNPKAWLWTRVSGDAMDATVLARGLRLSNPDCLRAMAATLALMPVMLLDILCAAKPK